MFYGWCLTGLCLYMSLIHHKKIIISCFYSDLKLLNSAVLLQRRSLLPTSGQQVVIHQAGFSADSFNQQQLSQQLTTADNNFESDLTPLLTAAFSADVQTSGGKFAIMLVIISIQTHFSKIFITRIRSEISCVSQ